MARHQIQSVDIHIRSFSYHLEKNRKIFELKNIDESMKKGDVVGIVGPSGSGKSTLLKILAGLIGPPDASISLQFEKRTIHNGDHPEEYLRHVSIITQESHIFSDTLYFNITLEKVSSEDRLKLFRDFWDNLSEELRYIKKWGDLLSHPIDPNTFSQGEKQLLAAIRSLYFRYPVVLYDEISSSLDPELEYDLRKIMLDMQKNSIVFVVAHRVETVRNASRILVLKDGILEGSGKHGELLKNSILYRSICEKME